MMKWVIIKKILDTQLYAKAITNFGRISKECFMMSDNLV